jgi:XTP/dITP diphosphohydrolase
MPRPEIRRLLIATHNKGKLEEFRMLLAPLKIDIVSLNDMSINDCPEENGKSFAENSALKAKFYAQLSQEWVLADDSGLEVTALNGAPGIFSARFGGEGLSDRERTAALLEAIALSGNTDRSARFVCSLTLADPKGKIAIDAIGICEGEIAASPRGSSGFGYDPIFIPKGKILTFAEMSPDEKQAISHRANAFRDFISKFHVFMGH